MDSKLQPLISVVTPVFNGEKYLAECIESVLAQTYENWEYTIVNNCSTDSTREIAQNYAAKEKRIRIHNNKKFVGVMANHNIALRQISAESKYCKVVEADDWLFPECIMQMVKIAEANPSVAIVGCYGLSGVWVHQDGLPYPSTVVSGRELCRRTLLGNRSVFGTPTSLLIHSDLIRNRKAFYNEANIHGDTEACYEVLQNSDFGFVHQVLVYSRVHNESVSSLFSGKVQSHLAGNLLNIKKYGPIYLNCEEYQQRLKLRMDEYYSFLAKSVFLLRNKEFWQYHKNALEKAGCPLSSTKLCTALLLESIDILLHPGKTLRKAIRLACKERMLQTRKFASQSMFKKIALGE